VDEKDREVIERLHEEPLHFNVVRFRNHGGVMTPLPLTLVWQDGATEEVMLPAEIWKRNPETFSKLFLSDQPLASVRFDDRRRTADIDRTNNVFPPEIVTDRFEVQPRAERGNPMRNAIDESSRAEATLNAFKYARLLRVVWASRDDVEAPIDIGPLLLEEVGASENRDPWGNPYAVSFGTRSLSDSEPFGALFVELVSAGSDGESGTDDDIAYWMSLSGEFHESAFAREDH
jgi:hypothetical protein